MEAAGPITLGDVLRARETIRPLVDPSPVIRSPQLAEVVGTDVWLKLENLQPPGSFKVRGAANKLASLTEQQRRSGVVTCSGGNHGAAVAYVAQLLGIHAAVCVPDNVDPVKLDKIKEAGAEAVVQGATFDDAVVVAHRLEQERHLVYVDPFDDPGVIAGQGTIGLELLEQVPGLAAVATAVSGGGLAGGVGAAVKGINPGVVVIGVSAQRAAAMAASVEAGHPVDVPYQDTLAEVLAGGIGLDNRWSFPTVQRYVDRHVMVTEEEIAAAMLFLLDQHRLIGEGGGCVPVAAALAGKLNGNLEQGALVLVVSGGNVDPARVVGLASRA